MINQEMLNIVNNIITTRFPAYANYVHPAPILVQATFPASQGAGVPVNAELTINNSLVSQYNIPQSQVWVITDLYASSASDIVLDATASFVKNGVKVLMTSAPLSTNYVGNNTRPGLSSPALYEPNSLITLPVAPISANGTTSAVDTFFLSVIIYDSTFS